MADNITLPGTGEVVRSIDLGGDIHGQAVVVIDSSGQPISSTLVTNGRGLNIVVLNDMPVKGMVAHGGDVQENPVQIGAGVTTALTGVSPLANGKAARLLATGVGQLLTFPYCHPSDQLSTVPLRLTTTGESQLFAAQGAGVRSALLGYIISNESAINTVLLIRDGSAGTVIGRIPISQVGTTGPAEILPLPIKTSANTAMFLQLTSASVVDVTPLAYKTLF